MDLVKSKHFSSYYPSKVKILTLLLESKSRSSRRSKKFIGPRSNRMLKIGVDLAKFILKKFGKSSTNL